MGIKNREIKIINFFKPFFENTDIFLLENSYARFVKLCNVFKRRFRIVKEI